MRCLLHGSFRKHFDAIKSARDVFMSAGIEVLAPCDGEIESFENGFALFHGEEELDPRQIELNYLQNLKRLGENGFSYFVNQDGYIGKSASYELGIAQVTNIPCFFSQKLDDHLLQLQQLGLPFLVRPCRVGGYNRTSKICPNDEPTLNL